MNILSKVLPGTANHQTIIVGTDATFAVDGDGVRIQLSPAFGHSVVIALDCSAIEKVLQTWPVPDVCDEQPFDPCCHGANCIGLLPL